MKEELLNIWPRPSEADVIKVFLFLFYFIKFQCHKRLLNNNKKSFVKYTIYLYIFYIYYLKNIFLQDCSLKTKQQKFPF